MLNHKKIYIGSIIICPVKKIPRCKCDIKRHTKGHSQWLEDYDLVSNRTNKDKTDQAKICWWQIFMYVSVFDNRGQSLSDKYQEMIEKLGVVT